MRFVHSANKTIAASIEAMKELVIARGGYVHPAAGIEERDGVLRAVCHAPEARGQLLFKVPDELLVPTDDLDWTQDQTSMQLAQYPADFSADRSAMLDLFIAIYNAAGKLAWLQHQAPRVLLRDSELAARLALVYPGYRPNAPSPAAAFIQTRNYSSKHAQAGVADKNCIMPLIDFVNHHAEGSQYRHGSGFLMVDATYAQDTEESLCNYGKYRDPLSLALRHGYLDRHCPFAQSVPVVIDLAGFGRFEILGRRVASKHPADLPKIEFSEAGLALSHLSGDVRSPHYLHTTLRLALMASGKRREIAEAATARALADLPAAILAANQEKLTAFRAYLATRPELPLASLLSDACLRKCTNLERILAG